MGNLKALKVGDMVRYTDVNRRGRGDRAYVSIIGHKYIYVVFNKSDIGSSRKDWGFSIETGTEKGAYGHGHIWTVEEYDRKERRDNNVAKIERFVSVPYNSKLTDAQIEEFAVLTDKWEAEKKP